MPLHVSSTCAHRQEVKIVLYSLWYHTYRCDDIEMHSQQNIKIYKIWVKPFSVRDLRHVSPVCCGAGLCFLTIPVGRMCGI